MPERRFASRWRLWFGNVLAAFQKTADALTTTATYGRGFRPAAKTDTYSITVYVGGFASEATADKRLVKEALAFQAAQGYSSHTILQRRFKLLPRYEYVVRFDRS